MMQEAERFEDVIGEGKEGGLLRRGDLIGVEEDGFRQVEMVEDVKKLTEELDERELRIMYLRFWEDWTLHEIGRDFGLSRERIRQIEVKVLNKMRRRAGIREEDVADFHWKGKGRK